jgi:hypothetical protein
MKYKIGDKVRINSLDWYKKTLNTPSKLSWIDKQTDFFEGIRCGSRVFTDAMRKLCGKVMTIKEVGMTFYLMEEDKIGYEFTDEMIECLVDEPQEKNENPNVKSVISTRKEQIFEYLKERNIPLDSLEANSIMEGIEWADEHPDSKRIYTKQQLIDMGFAFTLNGDIVDPDESNEYLKSYLKYQKQKFIEQAKEWLKNTIDDDVLVKCGSVVKCVDVDEFVSYFSESMEE